MGTKNPILPDEVVFRVEEFVEHCFAMFFQVCLRLVIHKNNTTKFESFVIKCLTRFEENDIVYNKGQYAGVTMVTVNARKPLKKSNLLS